MDNAREQTLREMHESFQALVEQETELQERERNLQEVERQLAEAAQRVQGQEVAEAISLGVQLLLTQIQRSNMLERRVIALEKGMLRVIAVLIEMRPKQPPAADQ